MLLCGWPVWICFLRRWLVLGGWLGRVSSQCLSARGRAQLVLASHSVTSFIHMDMESC